MNEIEYVFNSDIREKKRTARGARNKKCGSKSKKCSLPYETMKRKDLKAMNGSVTNYKLSEFYSWDEFLAMPGDIQIEYVTRMSEHYNVGLSTLSVTLFGRKDDQTLRKHFVKAGLMDKLKVTSHRGAQIGRVRLVDDMRRATKSETDLEALAAEPTLPSLKALAEDAKKSVVTIGERREEVAKAKNEMIEKARSMREVGTTIPYIAAALHIPEETVRCYLNEKVDLPQTTGFAQESQPSHLRDLMLEMDGFDLDALQFFAHKYENKKIKLTVTVTVVE